MKLARLIIVILRNGVLGVWGLCYSHGPLGINVEYRLNVSEIVMVNLLSAVSLHMSSKQK